MRNAMPPRMHSVLFAVKRAFHTSHWRGRRVLASFSLTPSRFDILYLLHSRFNGAAWQSTVRKFLGVTAATTSIMVRALEDLGFLRRTRSEDDRRQIELRLTDVARAFVRRIFRVFIGSRLTHRFVERLLCKEWRDKSAAFEAMDRMDSALLRMRRRLRDRAKLLYPWHPDD
jgi:DNA-binding MarR family transcriptional regulator